MIGHSLELPKHLQYKPLLQHIDHEGEVISSSLGRKVVRDDTNEVVGIVKSRARPTPFSDVWYPLVEGLEKSDLDLSGVEVAWMSSNNGARMVADITLKNYSYQKIVGEPMALAMRVYNSVDGSLAYQIRAYIKRLVCLNGMFSIAENTSVTFKHTAGTDPAKIGKQASTWPAALENTAHVFNWMKDIPIERDDIQNFLTTNLCVTKTPSGIKTNQKWLHTMLSLSDTYSASIGENTYALYNALTHYGSHVDIDSLRGADLCNRALRQEKDVKSLVQGKAFRKLIKYDVFERLLAA